MERYNEINVPAGTQISIGRDGSININLSQPVTPAAAPVQAPAVTPADMVNLAMMQVLNQIVVNMAGLPGAQPAQPPVTHVTPTPAPAVPGAPVAPIPAPVTPVIPVAPTTPPPTPAAPVVAPTPAPVVPPIAGPAALTDKEKARVVNKRAIKARIRLTPDQREELIKMADFSEAAVDAKINQWQTDSSDATPTGDGPAEPDPASEEEACKSAFAEFSS